MNRCILWFKIVKYASKRSIILNCLQNKKALRGLLISIFEVSTMSKVSFRARALDATRPMQIFKADEVPDLPDFATINRSVPQMPTGMEKEEETVCFLLRSLAVNGPPSWIFVYSFYRNWNSSFSLLIWLNNALKLLILVLWCLFFIVTYIDLCKKTR